MKLRRMYSVSCGSTTLIRLNPKATRVVFGLSSSPFLLNPTIKHHIEQYEQCDPDFTRKFFESIYVGAGESDVDSNFELYVKSKSSLKKAGFGRELKTGETRSVAGGNVDKRVC